MAAPDDASGAVRDVRVGDDGVRFRAAGRGDRVVDVHFDGRRVWSFWLLRDTESRGGERLAAWPPALLRFLDGSTTLSLVDHVTGAELAVADARLGSGEGRIAVVDKDGRPLGLDKSLALSRLFDTRDAAQIAPLLDAIDTVLDALRGFGVDAFLAYGTLLGAVREGGLIGHDSDADLGYVSRHTEPVDAILESFRLQRWLVERGFWVVRYSGMAFRVNVTEADGARRGLDVFGGMLRDGRLYLMGEVGAPFQESWVRPLSTATLEGRTFPVPAAPERLLEATYGPHWRTPDPAFKFETSEATRRRLDGWFRGTRGGRQLQWQQPQPRRLRRGRIQPSALLRWVLDREPAVGALVDLGCGAGADVYWMAARRGTPSWGLDFRPSHYGALADRARAEGVPAMFRWANFNELRSVLPVGAELARVPGPRVVLARHVVDAVDRSGREQLLRLAAMVTRGSGRLYLQVLRAGDRPEDTGEDNLTPLDVDELVADLEARGGRLVMRQDLVARPLGKGPAGTGHTDVGARSGTKEVSRLGVTWN